MQPTNVKCEANDRLIRKELWGWPSVDFPGPLSPGGAPTGRVAWLREKGSLLSPAFFTAAGFFLHHCPYNFYMNFGAVDTEMRKRTEMLWDTLKPNLTPNVAAPPSRTTSAGSALDSVTFRWCQAVSVCRPAQ